MPGRTRLRVIENRVRRRMLGPRRDAEIREWRYLHNENLYNIYSFPGTVIMRKSK
jgi:hypothetical protein